MDAHTSSEAVSSEDESTSLVNGPESNGSRSSSHGAGETPQSEHVIHLSTIEHCMPRAYIRVCFAYRVKDPSHLEDARRGLKDYVRRIVQAKPYLSGLVTDVDVPGSDVGKAEVRFTTFDYLNYPEVQFQSLCNPDGSLVSYDELVSDGLPPSKLIPENVMSTLRPDVDPKVRSPVFKVQGNVVDGGLIVAIYLHHCISDGPGFDLITSGKVLSDGFTFAFEHDRTPGNTSLDRRLKQWARDKSCVRQRLSYVPPIVHQTRQLLARRLDQPPQAQNQPGRGCIFKLSSDKILAHKERFNEQQQHESAPQHTTNSVIMALVWTHMTRARRPAVADNEGVRTSKLFIPVNIRTRLKKTLPEEYFGSAVDSARAELSLEQLVGPNAMTLAEVSRSIRQAVIAVDDNYVRELIDFAKHADALTDVHDIQAANMDRMTGADMYITSWLDLKFYDAELGLGLGKPDWVRKPWSRDPGSCIILPMKGPKPDYYEVVMQMTVADMDRLLDDRHFMNLVVGPVID